jgi:protein-S-isoprenylcysteine O-methyltransferase Ste14
MSPVLGPLAELSIIDRFQSWLDRGRRRDGTTDGAGVARCHRAAVLVFALAVVLAPGESVPPGVILLMCGVVLAILGVALVVLILRTLLAQAVDRDAEATQMRAELEEVI